MVPIMLKQVVVCAAVVVWLLGVSGCVSRSEYEAKVAEAKNQAEKAANAEAKSLQLQKDLDVAKSEAEKTEQAEKDAEARINGAENRG